MADERETVVEEVQAELPVPLTFRIPPRMPSLYAHHMFVQPTGHEIVLSFFEIITPIFPEKMTEDQITALREKGIIAECVARVTIAKDAFPAFVDAMLKIDIKRGTQSDANDTADNS